MIFPPQIGLFIGDRWYLGALGLLLTGIILPVLALWAIGNVGTDAKDLMNHVHPKCHTIFYLACGTLIGIGSTLPRCAATTHEIGVQNLIPGAPIWVTVVIFFALVYFFACDRDSVVDKLGKYLTPLLLILLAVVLIKGVISPVGVPVRTEVRPVGGLEPKVSICTKRVFCNGILQKTHFSFAEGDVGPAVEASFLSGASELGRTFIVCIK